MVGYRCYVLDAEDHILQAHDLDCETDEHAAAFAEALLNQDPYYRFAEVWRSTRRVAKLERHPAVRMRMAPLVVRSLGSAA
jgi:hypothetical protein